MYGFRLLGMGFYHL
jgi:hypothetical protein